ncbi:MAG TPA: PTS sugar transporter subunit IIA [Vulgatibacter sp.]|nr:PTS sugar transporter subunit IIA [Vulgatibacter sp.]
MTISDFLSPDAVIADLVGERKRDVLAELCAPIARRFPGVGQERLLSVLEERERLGSTGIGDGVAIPHGKLAGLPGLVATFGRSAAGVDFDALDGRPSHLFFALFAPESSAGIHLKALARISRLLKSAELRSRIMAAKDAKAIYDLLTAEDESR